MPIKLAVVLLVIAGLILFGLQNWSPAVPLIIFGGETIALPMALWLLGAITAGALTTVVIHILFGISTSLAPARRPRTATRPSTAFDLNSEFEPEPPDRGGGWNTPWARVATPDPNDDIPRPVTVDGGNVASGQDWSSRPNYDDWSSWGQPVEVPRPEDDLPNIKTPARDRQDDDWANWDGYEDLTLDPNRDAVDPEREIFRDRPPVRSSWEEEANDLRDFDDPDFDWEEPSDRPVQTDYEVQREPTTRFQSGSLYSYSYRDPSDSSVGKTESIYDADYQVIIPPTRSLDEIDQEYESQDDEDWDVDDEDGSDTDRPSPFRF